MYLFTRKTAFKGTHNKIHLNLSIALLLGLLVFVSGIETAKNDRVCVAICPHFLNSHKTCVYIYRLVVYLLQHSYTICFCLFSAGHFVKAS